MRKDILRFRDIFSSTCNMQLLSTCNMLLNYFLKLLVIARKICLSISAINNKVNESIEIL